MYKMKKRIYTLGVVHSGQKRRITPILKMTGEWLIELGFEIGDRFQVITSENEIILRKI